MRLSALLLVLLVASTSGCVENMDRLKVLLGAKVEPVYLPPEARAQANVTSVLVGVPVRFSAEGTRDPQGLGLTYLWRFGAGATAEGAEVVHAFDAAGEVRVGLTVTNEAGLSDTANVTLQVAPPNGAPTAALSIVFANGTAAPRAMTGERLTFSAVGSRDPDGGSLAYDWDFGNGATSHEEIAHHAYAKPGLYTVKLKVTDQGGLSAQASRLVAVGHQATFRDEFDLTAERKTHAFPVAEGALELVVTLRFPGGLGSNDLRLVVKDAAGDARGTVEDETPPGAQDAQVRVLQLTADELRSARAGDWTLEVIRAKGVNVAYTLEARESM